MAVGPRNRAWVLRREAEKKRLRGKPKAFASVFLGFHELIGPCRTRKRVQAP